MPARVVELPQQKDTWQAIGNLLDDWEELGQLLATPHVRTWEIAGSLHAWCLRKPLQCAYIRSLTQTAFFDRLVLGKFPPLWLVERFFSETIGLSANAIATVVEEKCGNRSVSWNEIERHIVKLLVARTRCHWANQPRRRRHLMKSVLDWHRLQMDLETLLAPLDDTVDHEERSIAECAPKIALHMRLSAMREIILSGFQQELYAPEEVPIAYWYAGTILEVHLECIVELLDQSAIDAPGEMQFLYDFLTTLKYMCMGMGILTARRVASASRRLSLNFVKRYKWLFRPEFDELPDARPLPEITAMLDILQQEATDPDNAPSSLFQLAAEGLANILNSSRCDDGARQWADKRRAFIQRLAEVAQRLGETTPTSLEDLETFDLKTLRWDPSYHPWFPTVVA